MEIEQFEKKIIELDEQFSIFEEWVLSSNFKMGPGDLEEKIESLSIHCQSLMKSIDEALKGVWKTDQPDLIDRFSKVKEKCHRLCSWDLTAFLKEEIYNALEKNGLTDQSPSIEALPFFGIPITKDVNEKLFTQGFLTVKDLKKASIFSQKTFHSNGLKSK